MAYVLLASIFFLSIGLVFFLIVFRVLWSRAFARHRRRVAWAYGLWFFAYALFIVFGTGPDLALYPPARSSPYKLPWRAGVTRFVAQGNRSFTSHRGLHRGAWDFWMPIGTEVLAARAGEVVLVDDGADGIGLRSNYVLIEHDDRTRAGYAHVRRGGVVVKVGDHVKQGQLVAYSGMVGQTLFPHVHFFVTNHEGTAPVPISFSDVPAEGVPLAAHFYTSDNDGR